MYNIPSILSILAFVTAATADTLIVSSVCLSTSCNHSGSFVVDSGSYDVNADGCQTTGIPGMLEFCVDWGNKRAHFRFDGQGKRCMRLASIEYVVCSDAFESATCSTETFEETPCDW